MKSLYEESSSSPPQPPTAMIEQKARDERKARAMRVAAEEDIEEEDMRSPRALFSGAGAFPKHIALGG